MADTEKLPGSPTPRCRRQATHMVSNRHNRIVALIAALVAIAVAVGCVSCRALPLVDGTPDMTRETVVLIHGMRRTGRSMRKMASAMREAGYNTVVCSYSSDHPAHEIATNLFAALGPVIEAAPRVHFVTHSLGGILVRDAFRDCVPPNLGRVVMLGPPNGGSQHIDNFVHLPFFVTIWGAPSPELGTGTNALPARLPPINFPCRVIAGTNKGLVGWMLPGENDGRVTVASASAGNPSEVLLLPTGHAWMMRNPVVISNAITFLRDGTFKTKSAEPSQPLGISR